MSAIFSACGTFRYVLGREIEGAVAPFVITYLGVNPSTAGASLDDQTIGKLREFTRRFGGSQLLVGNLFAYRSTDVKALAAAADPIGPDNDAHLTHLLLRADAIVPMWGSRSKLPKQLHGRIDRVREMLRAAQRPTLSFGLTQSGDPVHPLMLGYATKLRYWQP